MMANNADLDRDLHDCMTTIWKAYREATLSNNAKPFNDVFKGLYEKYDDMAVKTYIQYMGMGLAPAVNRRVRDV